ncbi:nucleotidyltransferase family protein [Chlorogloeopsis fritschii PCC 9212]|nr:hypothetical protein [Chlorogloeopsis fritschii]
MAKLVSRQASQTMNIYELLESKREEILQSAAKHGAYNIRIFGSIARREADANSDVDFLEWNLEEAFLT